MNSILSADHGCSGRKARCIRAVIIIEPYSLLLQFHPLQVWYFCHSHNSPYDPPAAYQYQTVILSFVSCSFSPFFYNNRKSFSAVFNFFPALISKVCCHNNYENADRNNSCWNIRLPQLPKKSCRRYLESSPARRYIRYAIRYSENFISVSLIKI